MVALGGRKRRRRMACDHAIPGIPWHMPGTHVPWEGEGEEEAKAACSQASERQQPGNLDMWRASICNMASSLLDLTYLLWRRRRKEGGRMGEDGGTCCGDNMGSQQLSLSVPVWLWRLYCSGSGGGGRHANLWNL